MTNCMVLGATTLVWVTPIFASVSFLDCAYFLKVHIGIELMHKMSTYIIVHESINNLNVEFGIRAIFHKFLFILVEYHHENVLPAHFRKFNQFLYHTTLSFRKRHVPLVLILKELVDINLFLSHWYWLLGF